MDRSGKVYERGGADSISRKRADYLVDTSNMLTRELKAELNKIFVRNKEYKNLYISVLHLIQIWDPGGGRSGV